MRGARLEAWISVNDSLTQLSETDSAYIYVCWNMSSAHLLIQKKYRDWSSKMLPAAWKLTLEGAKARHGKMQPGGRGKARVETQCQGRSFECFLPLSMNGEEREFLLTLIQFSLTFCCDKVTCLLGVFSQTLSVLLKYSIPQCYGTVIVT